MSKSICYKCELPFDLNDTIILFGYTICSSCKKSLGLLQDQTIKRHLNDFDFSCYSKFDSQSYKEEIDNRLEYLDKDYIDKKIKLLHIKERLEYL